MVWIYIIHKTLFLDQYTRYALHVTDALLEKDPPEPLEYLT